MCSGHTWLETAHKAAQTQSTSLTADAKGVPSPEKYLMVMYVLMNMRIT
jgi:hypothetical protein